jgi:aminopeptidase N
MLPLFLLAVLAPGPPSTPAPGVSEALARERAEVIRSLRYETHFVIPEDVRQPIRGRQTVRFTLAARHTVVLDFPQPRERVLAVELAGRAVEFSLVNGHLVVPAHATSEGENELIIEFLAGDEPLNRSEDFLYTLFVPARAQLAFPCFDQPDLKARLTLTLDVPSAWQVVANSAEQARTAAGNRMTVRFAETPPLPTYLFAFAAGKFRVERAERAGREFRIYHRETDDAKVARNRDAMFDLHAKALAWLEDYTQIPYPWGKFDIVLMPAFQFGGMEHAGAIFYNARNLMLDESATQNQLLDRASVIAHETSHMWFGDLVTMRWFDDVWTKEVMANFMAAKIVNPSFPAVNHDLRFLLEHYPSAYDVDRTGGANPIRQHLVNLNEAGSLYGNIIYDKAPIVMRQLEMTLGETPFRDGLREYLKRYAFGNAAWPDLVQILDRRTPVNLAAWSRTWVEQRGRPVFTTRLQTTSAGTIGDLRLSMTDPLGRGLVWPEQLSVILGYADEVRDLPVSADSPVSRVPAAAGLQRPLYVLPNGRGIGYGLFRLDEGSLHYLTAHLEEIPDALTRGSALVTVWENFLEGRMSADDGVGLLLRVLQRERDEQNAQRALSYLAAAFWRFLPPAGRAAVAPKVEQVLREGLARAQSTSEKSAWFSTLRDVALTGDTLAWLERVWRREEPVPGLPLAETDEISLAMELAVRGVPGVRDLLDMQLARIVNPDRKERFRFVMPALSPDPAERERSFERFKRLENRNHEPWVLEAQHYLNHPLREDHALRFVQPSLDLLADIRRTGDIFFPKRWMDATLSGHRSPQAAAIVRGFLARNPQYPERLRWVVLSAADDLFRSVRTQTNRTHTRVSAGRSS